MIVDSYSYILVVENISKDDASKLTDFMKNKQYFDGEMNCYYGVHDGQQQVCYFETEYNSLSEIPMTEVENTMHDIATAFPNAKFTLAAENLDNSEKQYRICTQGDMFQFAAKESYMPELSKPVPFDKRNDVSETPFEGNAFLEEFLENTDFNLLYEQKYALLEAQEKHTPLPDEVIDGLVGFLDFIGDWAEKEGRFQYPEMAEEGPAIESGSKASSLDSMIASASSRTGTASSGPSKDIDKGIE